MSEGGGRPNTTWSTFTRYSVVGSEKVVRIPVGVFISGVASRALGTETFGTYTLVLVLLTLFAPLASFGLESLGIALAARAASPAAYFRALGPFRLVTGALAAAAFVGLSAGLINREHGAALIAPGILGLASAVLVLRTYELGENVLFAQERLQCVAQLRLLAFAVSSVCTIAALLFSPQLQLVVGLVVLESALLFWLYGMMFREDIAGALHMGRSGSSRTAAVRHVHRSAPLFLSGLLVLLMLNIDKLLVYGLIGRAEAGMYNAAAKLVDTMYFMPIVIGAVHSAGFARAADAAAMAHSYRQAMREATLVSAAAATALALLAPWVVSVVFGSDYVAAAGTLTWLAPCIVPVTWVSLRTRALVASDSNNEVLRLTLIASVFHVPIVGAAAALTGSIEWVAAGQTASWLVAALVLPVFSPRSRKLTPLCLIRAT